MVLQCPSSDVTVVVVTWNGAHLLPACLKSLQGQTRAHRVLVVDNYSTDDTAALLHREFLDAEVLRLPHNTGFAGGVQAALDVVETPFLALLNNDATAEPDWLERLLEPMADASVAAVTSRILLTADGRINNAGGGLSAIGAGYDRGYGQPDGPPYDQPVEVAAFCGGAALLRTAAVRAVGGLPVEFFLYYEDTDLSWRLRRAGLRIEYQPRAVVHHLHSASSDPQGPGFAFYNQRNQLLMLLRNAPAGLAARVLTRFLLVTLIDLVRRPAQPGARYQHSFRHRLKVLAGVAKLGLATWRGRRAVRDQPVTRQQFVQDWLDHPTSPNRPDRPLDPVTSPKA
jgi:GT2 family glycosyltransferase